MASMVGQSSAALLARPTYLVTAPLEMPRAVACLLVALLANEFETQGVFKFAHVDPGGGHGAPDKRSEATGSQG